jgi:hypothetical protein
VACLIDELDQVFLKLIKGEKAAQGGDEGISHRFAYEDQASGPSFFDVPMPTSPEGPSSEQVLNVRLQGTRHSSFADINNLIASVMNDINTKKTSGCSHDDDFGYSFTLERAPILN